MSYIPVCFGRFGLLDHETLEKIYWNHLDVESRRMLRVANDGPIVGNYYKQLDNGRWILDPQYFQHSDPDALGDFYSEDLDWSDEDYDPLDFVADDGPWNKDDYSFDDYDDDWPEDPY